MHFHSSSACSALHAGMRAVWIFWYSITTSVITWWTVEVNRATHFSWTLLQTQVVRSYWECQGSTYIFSCNWQYTSHTAQLMYPASGKPLNLVPGGIMEATRSAWRKTASAPAVTHHNTCSTAAHTHSLLLTRAACEDNITGFSHTPLLQQVFYNSQEYVIPPEYEIEQVWERKELLTYSRWSCHELNLVLPCGSLNITVELLQCPLFLTYLSPANEPPSQ